MWLVRCLPDVFLKFVFQDDLSNVWAVGVEICLLQGSSVIAHTTACCYRTIRDYVLTLHV